MAKKEENKKDKKIKPKKSTSKKLVKTKEIKNKKSPSKTKGDKKAIKMSHTGKPVGRNNPPISVATQIKPGQVLNPNGRAKGKMVSTRLRELLEKEIEIKDNILSKKKKVEVSEALALKIVALALKGDKNMIKELLDRTEGKANQSINLSGNVSNVPDLSHLGTDELLKLIENSD
jgi:hypothetical protein